MAVTVTTQGSMPHVLRPGSLGILTGSIAFDSSYPTGGESITDITKFFNSQIQVFCSNTSGYLFEFDEDNNKLKVYSSAGNEVADTTDLSSLNVNFIAVGFVVK